MIFNRHDFIEMKPSSCDTSHFFLLSHLLLYDVIKMLIFIRIDDALQRLFFYTQIISVCNENVSINRSKYDFFLVFSLFSLCHTTKNWSVGQDKILFSIYKKTFLSFICVLFSNFIKLVRIQYELFWSNLWHSP